MRTFVGRIDYLVVHADSVFSFLTTVSIDYGIILINPITQHVPKFPTNPAKSRTLNIPKTFRHGLTHPASNRRETQGRDSSNQFFADNLYLATIKRIHVLRKSPMRLSLYGCLRSSHLLISDDGVPLGFVWQCEWEYARFWASDEPILSVLVLSPQVPPDGSVSTRTSRHSSDFERFIASLMGFLCSYTS